MLSGIPRTPRLQPKTLHAFARGAVPMVRAVAKRDLAVATLARANAA